MCRWPTSERTTEKDDVTFPQFCYFLYEVVDELRVAIYFFFGRPIWVIIYAVARILYRKHIYSQSCSHVVQHLVRDAQVLRIAMEKDNQLVGTFQTWQIEAWNVVSVS